MDASPGPEGPSTFRRRRLVGPPLVRGALQPPRSPSRGRPGSRKLPGPRVTTQKTNNSEEAARRPSLDTGTTAQADERPPLHYISRNEMERLRSFTSCSRRRRKTGRPGALKLPGPRTASEGISEEARSRPNASQQWKDAHDPPRRRPRYAKSSNEMENCEKLPRPPPMPRRSTSSSRTRTRPSQRPV